MMHMINRLLDEDSITLLRNMIGRKLVAARVNEEKLCDTQWIVQLDLDDGSSCYLDNDIDVIDYYGAQEDITAMKVHAGAYEDYMYVHNSFPVEKTICRISIVNYHVHSNNQKIEDSDYMYSFTNGIIMTFDDGSEMSFERLGNFIELIIVEQGNDLISKLEPISEYGGESKNAWEVDRSVEVINLP